MRVEFAASSARGGPETSWTSTRTNQYPCRRIGPHVPVMRDGCPRANGRSTYVVASRGVVPTRATVSCARSCRQNASMAIRRTDRKVKQTLPSRTALTDGGRFDLREGHDLERLLWPGTDSGDSTGLLQNFAVDGRRSPTVEPIKSAPSPVVKQGRSSDLHGQDDHVTPTVRRSTIAASRTHCPRRKRAPPQMR